MTVAFAVLWMFTGARFWMFPMVFAGLIPLVRGAVRFFTNPAVGQSKRQQIQDSSPSSVEHSILKVAKSENGVVTPALVALNTEASLNEAETALQDLVKRGYASMEVRDNGTVEYVFQEFLPKIGGD